MQIGNKREKYQKFGGLRSAASVLAIAAFATSSLASAQSSNETPSEQNDPFQDRALMKEVIVTAQKREENLQNVPISVTALSGEVLDELGVEGAGDVANFIPNVQFSDSGTIPQFNIRGVQLNDFGDGNEAPVGFYVDEVYIGTLAGQTPGLFDIERVEVLRGPQGTLFGRNTTGGLVHFVTKKPTDEFEGYLTAQLGSFNHRIVEAALSGPIADSVRGRVAVKYNKDDGWQEGAENGNNFAARDEIAVRGILEADLGPNALLTLDLHYADQQNTSQGYGLLGLFEDTVSFNLCSVAEALSGNCVAATGAPSNLDNEVAATEQDTLQNNVETFGGSVRLDWDILDGVELVSISAFETVDKFYQEDSDASNLPLFQSDYTLEASQFTQELRLAGSGQNLDWVTGLFYYKDDKDTLRFEVPQLTGFAPGDDVGINNDAVFDTESWALFAQVDYALTDELEVTAGARYTEDEKDLRISNDFDNPLFLDNETLSSDKVTWKFGLNWSPADVGLLYGSVSRGFKSGTFRTTFSPPGGAPPVGEEEVTSYEVGYKSGTRSWGRFSASAFYSDYKDLQANAVTTINGIPGSFLINVGDAEVYGLETEAIFFPTENIEVVLGAGLLDTEISSSDVTYDGNELARSPSGNLNGAIRYTFFDVLNGRLTLQASANHTGEHFLTPDNEATLIDDGYTLVGLRASWHSANDRYTLEAFVDNLLDEDYALGGYSVGDVGFNAFIWGRPQFAGVKAGVNF